MAAEMERLERLLRQPGAAPAIRPRTQVADVDLPWEFVSQTCSHTLLVRRDAGRYACEGCTAELVLRPLRARRRR